MTSEDIKLSNGLISTIETKLPDGGSPGIDLDIINGRESIAQSITTAMKTRLGEDPVSPHVGLPINDIIGLFEPDFIAGVIREAAFQDPRVKEVTIDVEERTDDQREKRIIEVTINITTIGNQQIEEIIAVSRDGS